MHGSLMHFILSVLLILGGITLMIHMITVDSEPGAIPLLLVMLGTGWFFITLFRTRCHRP
jgi:hypothetical protein